MDSLLSGCLRLISSYQNETKLAVYYTVAACYCKLDACLLLNWPQCPCVDSFHLQQFGPDIAMAHKQLRQMITTRTTTSD
jgi:hypothetical protein